MTRARRARRAGIGALLGWPLSYAWLPLAERSPGWVLVLVPLAEIGTVLLGIAAVWMGVRARRDYGELSAAWWGIGLGVLALTLVIAGNLISVAVLT